MEFNTEDQGLSLFMPHSEAAYQTEQVFFDLMFSLESHKMTALWPNDSTTFTFYVTFQIAYHIEQLLQKICFDLMLSLQSDEITALWANGSLNFTFYEKLSKSIPNSTTFEQEFLIQYLVYKVTKLLLCDLMTD